MAKRGTYDHPKTKKLARLLEIEQVHAFGLMCRMWEFAQLRTPQGDIGKYDDDTIANESGWHRRAEELIEAMVEARLLDRDIHAVEGCTGRLYVHDAHDHFEDSVHMALARKGLRFANGAVPSMGRLSRKDRERAEAFFRAPNPPREEPQRDAPKPRHVRTRPEAVRTETESVRTACAQNPAVCALPSPAKPSPACTRTSPPKEQEISPSSVGPPPAESVSTALTESGGSQVWGLVESGPPGSAPVLLIGCEGHERVAEHVVGPPSGGLEVWEAVEERRIGFRQGANVRPPRIAMTRTASGMVRPGHGHPTPAKEPPSATAAQVAFMREFRASNGRWPEPHEFPAELRRGDA